MKRFYTGYEEEWTLLFSSKKDLWVTIIIWGVSLFGIIIPLLNGEIIVLLIMMLLAALLLWFWFKTDYKIENDKIKIRYGPIRQTVHIQDIKLIVKAKTPLTAPALSMDRIQITCGKFDIVSISPVNQREFINELLKVKADILVDDRLRG